MALDGITVSALTKEIRDAVLGGRISRIAEPEANEILLTIKSNSGQYRLILSADPSLPLVYFTGGNKPSPLQAPGFLMLLRKHLQGGRIIGVTQPGLERILRLEIEHLNEMGDRCRKFLILELMGKHSNLVFTDDTDTVIDAIRRVSSGMSSVREVLPGRPYFIPNTREKTSPLSVEPAALQELFTGLHTPVEKALNEVFTGISPIIAREIIHTAGLSGTETAAECSPVLLERLFQALQQVLEPVKSGAFSPRVYYHKGRLLEFSPVPLRIYENEECVEFPGMSAAMEAFFAEKSAASRIRQRSVDLRHILQLATERTAKKRDIQAKQLKDTEKREKYKVYGELITAFGYGLPADASELICENYYDENREIRIPLDSSLTPQENAQRFFERYQKLKRTFEATTEQLAETDSDLAYLRSVSSALSSAETEEDLIGIKAELIETGWIRKGKGNGKKEKAPKAGKPLHFLSTDGFDIYVGKNNLQNEELTFRLATGNDWWFHVKGQPGSHVIVRENGRELTDRTFEEAAALAAWYSSAPKEGKIDVDYTRKKEIKKPGLYKPGMVIYHTNYSMTVTPSLLERQP